MVTDDVEIIDLNQEIEGIPFSKQWSMLPIRPETKHKLKMLWDGFCKDDAYTWDDFMNIVIDWICEAENVQLKAL